MTKPQKEAAHAIRAVHPQWYRAAHPGQRPTLAAMFRAGVLERRVWRVGKCSSNNAHEYRFSRVACDSLGLAYTEDTSGPPDLLRRRRTATP